MASSHETEYVVGDDGRSWLKTVSGLLVLYEASLEDPNIVNTTIKHPNGEQHTLRIHTISEERFVQLLGTTNKV